MDGFDLLRWILGGSFAAYCLWFACTHCIDDTAAESAASEARADAVDAAYPERDL